jgi:hypothetical protein
MKLVEYRDAGMNTYTYFYSSDKGTKHILSPFFNSQKEAEEWLRIQLDTYDNWKASKDIA